MAFKVMVAYESRFSTPVGARDGEDFASVVALSPTRDVQEEVSPGQMQVSVENAPLKPTAAGSSAVPCAQIGDSDAGLCTMYLGTSALELYIPVHAQNRASSKCKHHRNSQSIK